MARTTKIFIPSDTRPESCGPYGFSRFSELPMFPSARLDGIVVLVVDDNADARLVLAAILEHQGAQVLLADSGRAALVSLAIATPDVLLSDIDMPEMDGFSLIERIRANERITLSNKLRRALPAAAVTAHASEGNLRTFLDAGFHSYIPKPLHSANLIAEVERLAGRTP